MSPLTKLAVILVLWLPFSLGALLSVVFSLAAIILDEYTYAKNILRAMDKTLAAVLGFSGFFTLSAECGVATAQPWVALRWLLNKIQSGHCEGAAQNEGLTFKK